MHYEAIGIVSDYIISCFTLLCNASLWRPKVNPHQEHLADDLLVTKWHHVLHELYKDALFEEEICICII